MQSKNKIIGGGASVVAILIGSYFTLNSWVGSTAIQELQTALHSSHLDRAIRYKEASFSLLGQSVTLHDVQIQNLDGEGIPVSATKLIVSDVEMDQDVLTAGRVRLEGLTIPVLESAKVYEDAGILGGVGSVWKIRLAGLGYSTLSGSLEAYGKLAPSENKAELSVVADFDHFQTVGAEIRLTGVDGTTRNALIEAQDVLNSPSFMEIMGKAGDIMKAAFPLKLSDFKLHVRDLGFRSRYLPVIAERSLIVGTPDDTAKELAHQITEVIRIELEKNKTDSRVVDNVTQSIGDYVEQGGELTLSTHLDQSVTLFEKGGFMGIRPAPILQSIDRFFSVSQATLEHS